MVVEGALVGYVAITGESLECLVLQSCMPDMVTTLRPSKTLVVLAIEES